MQINPKAMCRGLQKSGQDPTFCKNVSLFHAHEVPTIYSLVNSKSENLVHFKNFPPVIYLSSYLYFNNRIYIENKEHDWKK